MSSHIVIQMRCYPMTEDKFYKLITSSKKLSNYSKDVLLIGIGLTFKVISIWGQVIYKSYFNPGEVNSVISKIEVWEYIAIIIAFFISFILWATSKYIISDRDKMIRDIKTFFEEAKNE